MQPQMTQRTRVSLSHGSGDERTQYNQRMKAITWAIGIVGLLACAGVATLFVITPAEHWDVLPVTALGAIIATCVAGVAALAATESVSSRRRHEAEQAINERRKSEYDKTIVQMVYAFTANAKPYDEPSIRAMLSLWASTDVLVEFRKFTELVNEIGAVNPRIPDSQPKTITPEIRPKIQLQVAAVAAAMRTDVMNREGRKSDATAEQIAEMIFNDYNTS